MANADFRELLDRPVRDAFKTVAVNGTLRAGVAISGGADSAMLAVAAANLAQTARVALHLLHVHHGLYEQADQWTQGVVELGGQLNIPVHVARVRVDQAAGKGIEAAAREARYTALAEMAREHAITDVFLAHHRSDQAETVLLRLLRGAGLAGLAAMAPATTREGIRYLRPWLDIDRALILQAAQAYAGASGWRPVQDPSNSDARYTRAALRELLTPVLDARWPGWQVIVTRHARHVAEAVQILDDVAREDFGKLSPSTDRTRFSLAAWRQLSYPRQKQVLRYWLAQNGTRMPTEARLAELARQLAQLHSLGHDRNLQWDHADHRIRCMRGIVSIDARGPAAIVR